MPHLNGKVERSHRVDQEEFYQLLDEDGIADNIHLVNDKLREWENYTITIDRAEPSIAKPHTNDCWQKPMPVCHRRLKTLQKFDGGQGWN
jgi:hypothetical protein